MKDQEIIERLRYVADTSCGCLTEDEGEALLQGADRIERLRDDRGSLLAFLRDRQRAAVAGGHDVEAEVMLGFIRSIEGRDDGG